MSRGFGEPAVALIEQTPPRVLFAGLLAGALERTRVQPTPAATHYLVELLEEQVRPAPLACDADGVPETLTEGLLRARLEQGAARIARLRRLGDRALFVSGFFGDSLERRLPGRAYWRDAGRLAYAQLATRLAERVWARLFAELADRFGDFVEVLTEVGDTTRAETGGLAGLYERFLRDGREADRRRLLRRGHALPTRLPRANQ